ncbi:hypothetical protein FQR65_LT15661 [Abscondita terminalis]|nr:hypothetical protein FQR65_LT15661 [Abscondita terminalis]
MLLLRLHNALSVTSVHTRATFGAGRSAIVGCGAKVALVDLAAVQLGRGPPYGALVGSGSSSSLTAGTWAVDVSVVSAEAVLSDVAPGNGAGRPSARGVEIAAPCGFAGPSCAWVDCVLFGVGFLKHAD